jgi:hypothetical protein
VYDWAREKAEKGMPAQPLPEKYKTAASSAYSEAWYDRIKKPDVKEYWKMPTKQRIKYLMSLKKDVEAKVGPMKTAGLLRPDQPRAKDVIKGRGPEKRKARAALRDKLREGCPMQKEALSADLIRRALSKATGRKTELTKQYGDLLYRTLGKKEIPAKVWKSVEPDLVREGSRSLRQTERFRKALAKKGSVDQVKLAAFFDELEKIKQAGLLRMLKPIKAAKPVKSIGRIAAESVGQHRALKAAKPRLVARVKSQYGSARKAA